jgi:uncharacterized protein involved in exopolysaccharide biosynthesis
MEVVTQQVDFDQLTLKDLVRLFRTKAILIVTFSLICGILAGVAAFRAPKWYQASVVLSPVDTTNNGNMANSVTSQLGGIAALAGLSMSGDSKKAEAVAVLQSEALTERYIDKNQLLPVLYQKDWDAATHSWKHPLDPPTLWKANQLFKKSLRTIAIDSKTGIVTLKIDWKDPVVAANWANGIVDMTNEVLRNKAITESERNVAYLTDQAARTNIVEVRNAIYGILEGEIKKAMLARGSEEYAFRIIDPARPSEKQSSPIKSLWIVVGLFAGFFISTLVAFIHSSWN